jgi:transcriptional regulator with XRE-family HTH domain
VRARRDRKRVRSTDMAKTKWTENHFRKRLKDERERRKWKQEELANKLVAKGIPMHWTSIAKIEKGSRSVRIDEAAAIADLFGISVDTMLGRRARPRSDQAHALMVAVGTAIKSSDHVLDAALAIRERIDELSALEDLPGREVLVAGFERAHGLLVDANNVLADVSQVARTNAGNAMRARR